MLLPLVVATIEPETSRLTYPVTRKVSQVDSYHGVTVSDPYRWLEEPISTPEVKAWVDAQNKVTFGYLSKIDGRERILKEMLRRVNFERFTVPFKQGGRYFWTRNDGLQNQDVVYVSRSLDGDGEVLIDPNTFSQDGTVSLVGLDVSLDGKRALFAKSSAGSDWNEWYVMDIETKKVIEGPVKWSKFGVGSLDKTGDGFYFLRFPAPKEGEAFTQMNREPKVMYHRIGDPLDESRLVFELPDHPDWFVWPSLDEARETMYLYVTTPGTVNNRLWAIDLGAPNRGVTKLFDENDADYSPVYRKGSEHFVVSTQGAPNGKVMVVDTVRRIAPRVLIPESKDPIQSVTFVGGQFLVSVLRDAKSAVKRYSLSGELLGELELPGPGTVGGLGGKSTDEETFYSYVSMDKPSTIYRYDLKTGKSTVYRSPKLPFDASRYESKQVFVTSPDGTRFPMFIAHKKGLKLDGSNPTILYGYGGFGVSQQPWFSTSRTVWMDMGGVFALACIRGGSEYGKEWHESATKVRRQNAYDDFISAAEWLVANKYTGPKRLAVQGGSNGGLLVGVVTNQRPDLFAVALPGVGVMDMLRFNQFTIGRAWEGDYGSPANADEFFALWRISPYHNLTPGTKYPAVLVTTADTDDRVVPAHSFKYTARLQECQAGPAPVLIRVETSAGHGGGTPITKALEELSDTYAFTLKNMGVKIPKRF
jgi:prolyl oligopeptidase